MITVMPRNRIPDQRRIDLLLERSPHRYAAHQPVARCPRVLSIQQAYDGDIIAHSEVRGHSVEFKSFMLCDVLACNYT